MAQSAHGKHQRTVVVVSGNNILAYYYSMFVEKRHKKDSQKKERKYERKKLNFIITLVIYCKTGAVKRLYKRILPFQITFCY